MNMLGMKNTGATGGRIRERTRCLYRELCMCIAVLTTCSQLYSGYEKMHIKNMMSITTTDMVSGQHLVADAVTDYDVAKRNETTHDIHDDHFTTHPPRSDTDVQITHATGPSITQFNGSSSLADTNTHGGSSATAQPFSLTSTALSKSSTMGSLGTNSTMEKVKLASPLPPTNLHDQWKDFYSIASSPIPKYTKEQAREATRPSAWQCTADSSLASNNGNMVAFVHVYKAAGTTIRQFFHELAYSCHKTWVSLARCTGVLPSTIQSRKDWKPCAIEEVADGRYQRKEQYMYPTAKNFKRQYRFPPSNPAFEKFVDIYGGHARLGTGDYIYPNSQTTRYIVFLRDPIERYVSGMLYQNKVHRRDETLKTIVQKVKSRIAAERRKDRYWDKSLSYLLTPEQRVSDYHFTAEQLRMLESNGSMPSNTTLSSWNAEARAKLAIHNLYKYNAIVGMTESMSESLDILKHVLLNGPTNPQKAKAQAVFTKFNPNLSRSDGVTANKSLKREVSTSAVVAELVKDEEHMKLVLEYMKYERMITDFAWTMHNLQYDCVAVG